MSILMTRHWKTSPVHLLMGSTDRIRSRRYELQSVAARLQFDLPVSRYGLYLAGWSEQSPLAVGVDSPSLARMIRRSKHLSIGNRR